MYNPADLPLYRARDLDSVVNAAPALTGALARSTLVRVRRGVYTAGSAWRAADAAARYRALVQATALELPTQPVLSHESAAALWGLPIVGSWPRVVHLLVERASGGRSDPGIRRHALGVPENDVTVVDGTNVTTLARTVVDLAAGSPLYAAVAAADAALFQPRFGPPARLTKIALSEQWERMVPFRGHARARSVIDFADSQAGSTSESTSRASIALLGFPAPVLQRRFVVHGEEVFTDFYWEEVDGVGECDGESKYTDPRIMGGRSIHQVVMDEKRREDALRRQVSAFARWTSAEAMTPSRLRVKLLELGLRQGASRLRGR